MSQLFGFLNIDKPKGISSFDVIRALRKVLKIKQIGHTGTLDPLATGVLPIAIGKASRLIEYLKEDKNYVAQFTFGITTDSYDSEGGVLSRSDIKVTKEQIEAQLNNFRGKIMQKPPIYSAIKINGEKLYNLARKGQAPTDIASREVLIDKIELLDFDFDKQIANVDIHCSRGTYIRSIAHDLGQTLDCGAIMTELSRTKSGLFTLENAVGLDEITTMQDVEKNLINPLDVLVYNRIGLDESQIQKVSFGQSLEETDFSDVEEGEIVVLEAKNKLLAIARKEENRMKMEKVFI